MAVAHPVSTGTRVGRTDTVQGQLQPTANLRSEVGPDLQRRALPTLGMVGPRIEFSRIIPGSGAGTAYGYPPGAVGRADPLISLPNGDVAPRKRCGIIANFAGPGYAQTGEGEFRASGPKQGQSWIQEHS